MIVTGELAPGDVVTEADLCEVVGCTRTPLREALQQLRHEYLVVLPLRRGVLIPQLSISDFQQAHEAMLVVYTALADLAAERISDGQLEELHSIIAEQRRANEAGEYYQLAQLDYRFHTLVAESTGNRYLLDCVSRLHGAVARFVYRAFEASGSAEFSIGEHDQILEALERRDPDLARERVRQHSIASSERAVSILGLPQRRNPGRSA